MVFWALKLRRLISQGTLEKCTDFLSKKKKKERKIAKQHKTKYHDESRGWQEREVREQAWETALEFPSRLRLPAGSQKVCTDCYPLPHVPDSGKLCMAIY